MLENFSYCPTLYARQAEVKALAQLSAATKDRLFPLIIARPWPRAKHLNMAWAKIKAALGKHRFALDLDPQALTRGGDSGACIEFARLFEGQGGFANYYEAVSQIDEAIPVLRISDGIAPRLEEQAAHIEQLDRGLVLRLQQGVVANPLDLADTALSTFEDISIFIDVGWGRDILNREVWASNIIEHVSARHPEIELVVTGSSFPESFSDIGARGVSVVEERVLYDNLVRRHNAAILVYGDWGSTRPPRKPVPMTNVPRIDLPDTSQWVSFRRDQKGRGEEDYADVARRVISDDEWPDDLDIWGTQIIDWTAKGETVAIRSPITAAAARINIHLHRQAYFGVGLTGGGDEPYTDD